MEFFDGENFTKNELIQILLTLQNEYYELSDRLNDLENSMYYGG